MKTKTHTTTFDEYLDHQYGKIGSPKRDKFEQGFEVFKIGVILEQMRKSQKMTQDQLAKKCVTSKSYISRIENDASDIRLSTLIRIIHQGFGGRLKLTVELDNKIIDFDL